MSSGRAINDTDGRAAPLLSVLMVCALSLFAGLGSTALWEPDEPRFAEATRQMLERGDFLTPWFNDHPRFEKPVLIYWLQLPFFALQGGTEAAARAPSAICGLLAVLAVFGLGRDLVSVRAGVLSAVMLATTFRFVLYARQGLTDVPVTAAVGCALWAMSRAVNGSSRALALVAWVLVGVGVLLKGPVGLLAPLIWTAWAALSGGWAAVTRTRPIAGALVAALVAAPWFVAMGLLHGQAFLDVALRYEVVARYLSADFPGRDRGFSYFWGVWLGDGAPWSLFLIPAFYWAWTERSLIRRGEAGAMRLAGIWFLAVLLVFSASQYKLPHYIVPAYPAMALATGVFANAAIEGRAAPLLWRVPAWLAAALLGALAILLWLLIARVFERALFDTAFLLPLVLGIGAVAVAALTSIPAGRPAGAFATLAAVLALCFGLLATVVASRELRRFQPIPDLAAAARRTVAASEPLAVAGNYGAAGLVFYARHPVQQLRNETELVAFLSAEGRRHCVLPEADLERVRPLVNRPLRVQAEASVFSVRLRRLLEREPERAGRVLVLVTAE
jgi:4-amino-4-deoxy-L-arabinose transferase-like glycosyltransferase